MRNAVPVLAVILASGALTAHAQPATVPAQEEGRFAVGFQRFTWNAWGPSVLVRFGERVDLQLLYGVLYQRSGEKDVMVRGRFRVAERGPSEVYLYGGAGQMWLEEWSAEETGSVLAAGVGVAYHPAFLSALSLEGEIGGETVRGFDVIDGNYDSLVFSAGVHIRF